MVKLPFKKRSIQPTQVFSNSIAAAALELASKFLKSESFSHLGSRGSEREIPVQNFFKENIPAVYNVVKGEVVDLDEQHSPQLDVMIYDSTKNFAFYEGENYILPAEALLVSIEVKTKLDKNEIRKSFRAANLLRKLKPFGKTQPEHRTRGEPAGHGDCSYFHCIFAYQSNLVEKYWFNREYNRIKDVSDELGIPSNVINRIYVVNRGLYNLVDEKGIKETPKTGTSLVHLYMHTLNFLVRENDRRPPSPYVDYAGRLSTGWESLTG